jgi:hypothetical protein
MIETKIDCAQRNLWFRPALRGGIEDEAGLFAFDDGGEDDAAGGIGRDGFDGFAQVGLYGQRRVGILPMSFRAGAMLRFFC